MLHPGCLPRINELGFVHRLTVRQGADKILAIHASEKGSTVLLNGAHRLFLEVDDFLPLHFRGRRHVRLLSKPGRTRTCLRTLKCNRKESSTSSNRRCAALDRKSTRLNSSHTW